ncbi:DUF4136 domain-containing protein [Solitalea koreensis]|uniref:DUF4136 domain-containing protein n=1 Tax=Solitalea koreensis TaxID=543615 RepID=A0A521E7H1_9SPHI|nr:DUF4136 domain-containing protein [Solitalea koreensis]SMO79898.1 protein of unknown function [Solitalea koreensis]
MRNSTLLVLLIVTTGCTSYQISTDKHLKADFSTYKSYAWLPPTDTIKNSAIDRKKLIKSVFVYSNTQLNAHGMMIDTQNPDLLIRCYTMVQNKNGYKYNSPIKRGIDFNKRYKKNDFPGMYINVSPEYSALADHSVEYEEGTLLIETIDLQTRKIIWSGKSGNALAKTRKLDERLQKAIEKIFKHFPAKPRKK